MRSHIHISAIDCTAREYDASKGIYVCTKSKWQEWSCDVDTCMSCKRSRQWLEEQNLKKGSMKMTKFYDWNKALSNTEDMIFTIGAHGAGREFEMRKQVLQCQEEQLRKEPKKCRNSTTGTRRFRTTRT